MHLQPPSCLCNVVSICKCVCLCVCVCVCVCVCKEQLCFLRQQNQIHYADFSPNCRAGNSVSECPPALCLEVKNNTQGYKIDARTFTGMRLSSRIAHVHTQNRFVLLFFCLFVFCKQAWRKKMGWK